jgi:DinB superfamily
MSVDLAERPAPTEYAEWFDRYISLVPDGPIVERLEQQQEETLALLRGLPPGKALHAYAPGKWTVAELVGHVADSERVFAYRALCFARGGSQPQPGFDEKVFAANIPGRGGAPFSAVIDDYAAVRRATLSLLRGFTPEAWERRGLANAKEITVRAQAWVIAGHERHHVKILKERYL